MKIDKCTFIVLIDLIVAIFAVAFSNMINLQVAVWIVIVTIVITIYSIVTIYNHHLSFSSVLLLYTIATQFGLVIPYVLFGKESISEYSDYTLRFMNSEYLVVAILMGNLAVVIYEFVRRITLRKQIDMSTQQEIIEADEQVSIKMYVAAMLMLLVVMGFFAFHIITGGMRLFGSYEEFRNSSVATSSMYSYILILFYAGTLYLAASGKIMNRKIGWVLWVIMVVIFAMNGNKGEFLYALLAVLGLKGVQGQKISFKMLLLVAGLLFVVIPTITFLRSIGIAGNLNNSKIDFFASFAEMGMQIRTSVHALEELDTGRIDYLWGMSYIQPIINIVFPFSKKVATMEFRNIFYGYGFNQVIESYLNFGYLGVVIFFGCVSSILVRAETKQRSNLSLAWIGTITCVLINASRNYFAFVPGQIVIVSIIYLAIKIVRIDFKIKERN